MTKLLTVTGNPKTAKGRAKGYAVAVLHLAPSNLSGFNVCPMATQECIALCLNTAGRGGIMKAGETTNTIQRARIARTQMLYGDREAFGEQLVRELMVFIRWCEKKGFKPALRLNGTSDLNWSALFPRLEALCKHWGVTLYDYTKVPSYLVKRPDVHLTLSYTGYNDAECTAWLAAGRNVAVVFKKGLPQEFLGFPVINADEDDLRFLDPPGTVCGLKAKGKARKAINNAFVVGS